jgi:hypothetical protein
MTSGRDHDKHPWGGAPAMMAINHRPSEQGPTLPLDGPHQWPGEVLLCAGNCVGLLLVVTLMLAS